MVTFIKWYLIIGFATMAITWTLCAIKEKHILKVVDFKDGVARVLAYLANLVIWPYTLSAFVEAFVIVFRKLKN